MAREADSIVRLVAAGEVPDQVVRVVGDQVLTATPADVGKVVTVAADGTLVLAAGGGGGGVSDHGDLTGLGDDDHAAVYSTLAHAHSGAYVPLSLIDAADDLIVGSADNTAARLAVAASRIIGKKATGGIGALTSAEVLAITGAPAWQQRVDDAAAALTDWTTISGTWAAAGGVFSQSGGSAAYGVIRHNSEALGGSWILEARIRFPAAGQVGSGSLLAGIGFGHSGVAGNETLVPSVRLSRPFNSSAGALENVYNNGANSVSGSTLALDTWYKLRIEAFGAAGRVLLDGVEVYAASWGVVLQRLRYPFLYTHNAKADFDDIKVWTLTSGMPA